LLYNQNRKEMKTTKVTYRTNTDKVFNTIIPLNECVTVLEILDYMYRHYRDITVIKIRPSIKQRYSKVCNYRVK